MKKYWYALAQGKAIPGLVAGAWLVMALMAVLGHPQSWWDVLLYPFALAAGGVLAVALMCRPAGIWARYWVADGAAHQEHLLTRKMRTMPLNAPFAYRKENGRTCWLILAEEPVDSVKAARKLYRQGKALFLPVGGPLAADETLAKTLKQAKKMD